MFRDYVRFTDALLCFKLLQSIKDKWSPEWNKLRGEFFMYAKRRSHQGDPAARQWLDAEGEEKPENSGDAGQERTDFTDTGSINTSPIVAIIAKAKLDDAPPPVADLSDEAAAELFRPLDALTGLETVKAELKKLLSFARIRQKRKAIGLPVAPLCMHMAFTGNPGTGKTTVARLLADMFRGMGYLRKGHFVETSRAGLIGEYVGQTAQKTERMFKSALGGVLFIDEAYNLFNEEWGKDYGSECTSTLLKLMEDHRDDIVVVFAGYPKEMDKFLKSNPGLASRVPTHLHFDDFSVEALLGIFESLCTEYAYRPTAQALRKVRLIVEQMNDVERRAFANGRGVRTLFQRSLKLQAQRLVDQGIVDTDLMSVLEDCDIPSDKKLKDENVLYLPTGK